MSSADWGTKHLCLECASKYYDMGKTEDIVCPNCGAKLPPEKPRRGGRPAVRSSRSTFAR